MTPSPTGLDTCFDVEENTLMSQQKGILAHMTGVRSFEFYKVSSKQSPTKVQFQKLLKQHRGDLSAFCDRIFPESPVRRAVALNEDGQTPRQVFVMVPTALPECNAEVESDNVPMDVNKQYIDINELWEADFQTSIHLAKAALTHSQISKIREYSDKQSTDSAILDGRVATEGLVTDRGPPVELYHPVYSKFNRLAEDTNLEVPQQIYEWTVELMGKLSVVCPIEKEKEEDMKQTLMHLLGITLVKIKGERTHPD